MYAIGVDSGTQSTKVLIIDLTGSVLGRGSAPHDMVPGLKPGESEQDPKTWLRAFENALVMALEDSGISPENITSLGISGQQHGCVPLDEEGNVLRPAKLWNDTSTVQETEKLVNRLGGNAACIDKLGIGLAVGYTASKILWLKKHEPENFSKLKTVLLPHNFLNFILTGKRHMEYGDASGTGLMEIRSREWNEEALTAVDPGLLAKLPVLSHPKKPAGLMTFDFASRYGMKEVLVSAGGGDNMMGAIGTGNTRPGVCTLSLGTSGTVYSYFDTPFVDPEGEIAAFCDSTGGWLPLLCTMNVTNTTEQLKSLLTISTEEMEILASQAPSGSDGLMFLPFLMGERVPVLPEANGVLFGMTSNNMTRPHMVRAFMEGTVLNLGYGFNRMKDLGLAPTEIRATGGGANSSVWLQIVADIFQTPVVSLKEQEAAALGAAIQSIWCYHREWGNEMAIQDLTDEMVEIKGPSIKPRIENIAKYERLQDRFNSLWKTLRDEFEHHRKSD